ncbi:MAG: 2-octaprenyl-6-methoxyphenyl hydroxylase [Cellvibrionaceae bacterium]|nr:2-octaprenyl-6-methoxyphenyl hydroxylase [Cellvibrionaceae bacterium]MCV6627326.1 2-octaprenyl-6-methoxyphenyl hydroxylase [Cellvibrionaceae bacterium]
MSEAKPYDLVIVGGGMVGVSLALLLAEQASAWRIALVETFAMPSAEAIYQPSFDARTTALSLGTIEILQQLGLWGQLSAHHTPIHKVHVSDRGHFGGSEICRQQEGVELLGAVVANAWLGRVLLGALSACAGVDIYAPATVAKLSPKQRGSVLQLQQGDESFALSSQLVLLADGGDSPLSRSLGLESVVEDYYQSAIIANVEFEQPHNGTAFERFTEDGPLALLPLGEGPKSRRSALVWTQPRAATEQILALGEAEFLQRLQHSFGQRLGRFTKVGERSSYPLQLKIAREQVRSGLVLMGNAAHYLHPVAGQGFNLALRDCAVLVEQLSGAQQQIDRGGANAPQYLGELSVLQQYLDKQQLDQDLTVGFSDSIVRLFSSANSAKQAGRALGLLGLELLPGAKKILAQQTMGLAGRKPRI